MSPPLRVMSPAHRSQGAASGKLAAMTERARTTERPGPPDGDEAAAGALTVTAHPDERPTHAGVHRVWLVVGKGPDTGAPFTSAGERAVIGTHESADFVLHDETVSRFHCEIDRSTGTAVGRDLGSRTGTV